MESADTMLNYKRAEGKTYQNIRQTRTRSVKSNTNKNNIRFTNNKDYSQVVPQI